MGLRDWLTRDARTAAYAASAVPGITSPWAGSPATSVVWSDIFGHDAPVPNRAEAMQIPAIAKARALIIGTLARQPLAKFQGETRVDAEPWMYRTNGAVPPQTRMAWTLDDLIFYGQSLWGVERGARGEVLDAWRIPIEEWEVTPDLEVRVQGQQATADQVIFFSGPQDGLLEMAKNGIRAAKDMEGAWAQRVRSPLPMVVLKGKDSTLTLDEDEIAGLLRDWEKARQQGGTAYLPPELDLETPGTVTSDLFIEGRNASRLDVANWLCIPAALLEGSTATASLTYSTQEGHRNELVDYSLAFWATPIEARLSMDDVVPRGSRVAFDLTYFAHPTTPASGPSTED